MLLRWAGSKKQLVKPVIEAMRETAPFWEPRHGYYEPFFGSGAIFFALAGKADPTRQWATLSDGNVELMNFWRSVRDRPELIADVEVLAAKYARGDVDKKREFYIEQRARFNEARGEDSGFQAARFFFLNRTCFNGLYRVNRRGGFNVPFGKVMNPAWLKVESVVEASGALHGARLSAGSFDQVKPHHGSMLYLDPPYPGTFTGYDGVTWNEASHQYFAEWAWAQAAMGVHVVISQPDCELSRRLFKDWASIPVVARRSISAANASRGSAKELIFFRKRNA
jgi:DNA adenine methylase